SALLQLLVVSLFIYPPSTARPSLLAFLVFQHAASSRLYTLSLHDALPISASRPRRILPLRLTRCGRRAAHVARPAVRIVRPRHGALPQLDVARGPQRQHRALIELRVDVAQTQRDDRAGSRAQRAAHEDPLQVAAGDDRAEHRAGRGADARTLEDAALVTRQPRLRVDHVGSERVAAVADLEPVEVDADRGDVAGPRGRVDAR